MGLSGVQIVSLVAMVLAVVYLVILESRTATWTTRHVTSKLPFTLTADAEERLRQRMLRDQRGTSIAIGVAGGVLFVATTTVGVDAVMVPVLVSVTAIAVVAHLVAPFQQTAELLLQPVPEVLGGRRVARARALVVEDYVSGTNLTIVRVTTAASVLLMGTIAVGFVRQGATSSALPFVGAGIAVLLAAVGVEGGAWLTVRRARPAANPHALMSDDAVVAYGLRAAFLSLASIAFFATVTLPLIPDAVGLLPWPGLRVACLLVASVGWLVASNTFALDSSVRRFLVRLWGKPSGLPAPVFVPARPGNPYRGGPS